MTRLCTFTRHPSGAEFWGSGLCQWRPRWGSTTRSAGCLGCHRGYLQRRSTLRCEPCCLQVRKHTRVCERIFSRPTSLLLTDFANFGLLTEMTHEGQVKVPVLVYKGNLSLCGRAALIQSDLQHLQLHVNNNIQKSRGVNDRGMTKKRDLTVFLTSGFRQCPEERDVCEHVCVFGQSQLAPVQCLGAVECWQRTPRWQTLNTAKMLPSRISFLSTFLFTSQTLKSFLFSFWTVSIWHKCWKVIHICPVLREG